MASHPIASYARTAYAQGVAASGGPITDRVRAGCVAAVEMACARPDSPHILEATLHLGRLEGTWARIYERRTALHAVNDRRLADAWRQLLTDAAYGSAVDTIRQHFGLTEAVGRALAASSDWIAVRIRQLLNATITGVRWFNLRTVVRDALARARAEGRTGALALGAEDLGVVGFDFDLAFEDAYGALGDIDSLIGDDEIDVWLSNLLADASSDVGQRLAVMVRDGADRDTMIEAMRSLLGDATDRAVTLAFDLLTSRAMSQGAVDLYRREGVDRVEFITAGDDRVCNLPCYEAEQNSPYLLANAPIPGLHPWCRCTLAAADPLPYATVAAYAGDDVLA